MAKGFTLIELLIVVAIIGILAAIAIPNFLQAQIKAKIAVSKQNLRTVALALDSYYIDYGTYILNPFNPKKPYNLLFFTPANPNYAHLGNGGRRNGPGLTTPLAYLQEIPWRDPFGPPIAEMVGGGSVIRPCNRPELISYEYYFKPDGWNLPDSYFPDQKGVFLYELRGIGPTKVIQWEGKVPYDPKNGLKSQGNILYYGPGRGIK